MRIAGALLRIRVVSWDFTFQCEVWKWGWGGLNEFERPVYFHAGEAHRSTPLKVEGMASLGLCRGDMLAWHLCPHACVSFPVPFTLPWWLQVLRNPSPAPTHPLCVALLSCWGWERARRDNRVILTSCRASDRLSTNSHIEKVSRHKSCGQCWVQMWPSISLGKWRGQAFWGTPLHL